MDERLGRIKSYSKTKHYIAIWEVILTLSFFIIIQASGFSSFIARGASGISANGYIAAGIYIAFVGLLLNIAGLPLDFLSSFKVEHAYGLSRQSFSSWAWDYLKRSLIGGLFLFAFILLIFHFLKTTCLWWLYTALAYFAFSVVLAKVFPVLIIPLFYRLTEISDGALKSRLVALAERAGVRILNVYKIGLSVKTKKANAAVCGLGSTKRILLSDTLMRDYSDDEIEATLAHELAHHKYLHFWKLTFFGFISTLLGFLLLDLFIQAAYSRGDLSRIYDIAFFPKLAVLFIIYNIVVTPLHNFISRMYETEADMEAARLIKKPAALASLLEKLTAQNLSDPSPGRFIKFFFYSHPPASERIRMCGGPEALKKVTVQRSTEAH